MEIYTYTYTYTYTQGQPDYVPLVLNAFKFQKALKIIHFSPLHIEGHIKLEQYWEKGT